MSKTRKTSPLQIVIIVLLAVLLAAGLGGLWLNSNYKGIIQRKLPEVGAKATDSLYQVKAGDVDIDLLGRKVVITDFELLPDEAHIARLRQDFNLPEVLFTIHIDHVVIDDVAWGEVLRTSEIVAGSVEVHNPVIRITKLAGGSTDSAKEKKPPVIQAIKAGRIAILNPDILYRAGQGTSDASYIAKGGRIDITDWQFDLRQPNDSTRLFYATHTAFRVHTLNIIQPGALTKFGFGSISYNQEGGRLDVRDVRINAAVSNEEVYRRVGHQKEIYNVQFPSISLNGLDWQALLRRKQLIAEEGRIADAAVNIYMSRIPPLNPESKDGKFPQQLLMKLKLPVFIPLVHIDNGRVNYTEKSEKTMAEGTIPITGISGTVRNITNMPARLRENSTCTIQTTAELKGSRMEATFRLKIDSKKGAFSIAGRQSPTDGTRFNDITRPLALAEIRSLRLGEMRFSIDGDETGAKGRIAMRYEDLKVHLLEPEKGGLDKKDVSSFLANKLLVHSNNPEPGKELRIAHPYYERDNTKSFFNLIWKTLFTGILQTASRNVIKLDKVVNKRQQKGEAQRREDEQGEGEK